MRDREWFDTNRAWWEERTPLHLTGGVYEIEPWLHGRTSLRPFELAEMGDVRERTLVHVFHDDLMSGSYGAPDADTVHNQTWERVRGIGEVISAVADAGFRIDFLHELDWTIYDAHPWLVQDGRRYTVPAGVPRVPLMYSLRVNRSGRAQAPTSA